MTKIYFSYSFFSGVLIIPSIRKEVRKAGGKIFKIKKDKAIRIDVREEDKESLLSTLNGFGVSPERIIEPVSRS